MSASANIIHHLNDLGDQELDEIRSVVTTDPTIKADLESAVIQCLTKRTRANHRPWTSDAEKFVKNLATIGVSLNVHHPKSGATPLMLAIALGHEDLALALANTRAVNVDVATYKDTGHTPLAFARAAKMKWVIAAIRKRTQPLSPPSLPKRSLRALVL